MVRMPFMLRGQWLTKWFGAIAGLLLPLAGVVHAQEAPPTPPAGVAGAPEAAAVRREVDRYLKEIEAKRKADEEQKKAEDQQKKKEAEAKGVEVGSNLSLTGTWDNSLFFVSPNRDWRIHVGGRFEFNSVWWQQPQSLMGLPTGPGGIPAAVPGGIGVGLGMLDDGSYFRRVRFRADGTAYELVEFAQEVDFENLNYITFDHLWVGPKEVPFLGTVRVGQHKVPQGLEMIGSDYYLTFLERSSLSDAFWTLFAPGVYVSNTYFDRNVTSHAMFHRVQPLQFYDGAAFGDGDYAWTGRLTATPYYAHDGACVVHLGGSYQWRHGNLGREVFPGGTGNAFADTQSVARFRARAELRDAVGILVPVIGDAARFVDTGYLLAEDVQTISPEFMTTWGPLNVRAEAAFAFVYDARSIYPAAAFNRPRGDPIFWGGYVQASYFLTGEHWGYDRRFGVYDRPKVNENAFLVRGEDGRFHCGTGAWEVAYRFSYLDLNDNGINGGQLAQHTLGINWYLNDNFRIQANYLNVQRNVAAPANSGTVHGFGMQAQFYF